MGRRELLQRPNGNKILVAAGLFLFVGPMSPMENPVVHCFWEIRAVSTKTLKSKDLTKWP